VIDIIHVSVNLQGYRFSGWRWVQHSNGSAQLLDHCSAARGSIQFSDERLYAGYWSLLHVNVRSCSALSCAASTEMPPDLRSTLQSLASTVLVSTELTGSLRDAWVSLW